MADITVIIPVIEQHYATLPRAIQSVKDSTLAAEVLIVNDGYETLGTLETPAGVRMVATARHTGTAHARNVGIDACDTPLVFFLDADDFLVANALEVLYKAYVSYTEACYVYGDWFQFGKNGDMQLHAAKPYDRARLIRHTIHTVNILTARETLLAVNGFDETFPAWEDYDLFIRLALNGYCGVRVPYPIIVYDMLLGINREQHDIIGQELHPKVIAKYSQYKGEKDFMPCQTCGGNRQQRAPINTQSVPPPDQNGLVTLEFTGQNTAPIKFKVQDANGQVTYYRGANDNTSKYLQVLPAHAQQLLQRGPWRQVVRASAPSMIPPPQDFEAWRKKNQEMNARAQQMAQKMTAQGQVGIISETEQSK